MLAETNYVDQIGGDLAAEAHAMLAKKMAGNDLMFREEVVVKRRQNLRNEIGGPNPSPIRRLLVERIVACWTYLNYLELIYTQNDTDLTGQSLFRQKVLDRAHGGTCLQSRPLADVRGSPFPPYK